MVAVLPPSSVRTVGAAIVMTVLSSRSMISATRTIASTSQRRRKGAAAGGETAAAGAEEDMGVRFGSGRGRRDDERRSSRTPYVTNVVRVKLYSSRARPALPSRPSRQGGAQPRGDRRRGAGAAAQRRDR